MQTSMMMPPSTLDNRLTQRLKQRSHDIRDFNDTMSFPSTHGFPQNAYIPRCNAYIPRCVTRYLNRDYDLTTNSSTFQEFIELIKTINDNNTQNNNNITEENFGKTKIKIDKIMDIVKNDQNYATIDTIINTDINTTEENGLTLLKIAVVLKNVETVKKILTHPKFELLSVDILAIACDLNLTDVIKELCNSAYIDVNKRGGLQNEAPITYAVKNNNTMVFTSLAKRSDLDVNVLDANKQAPLHIALLNRQTDLCSLLLQHPKFDIHVKTNDGDLLKYFVQYGEDTLIKQLITHPNFKITDFAKTVNDVFVTCVCNTNITNETLSLLLPHVNVNHQDMYGNTALIYCCKNNKLDRVNLLLSAKLIDTALTNKNNMNALMCSIDSQHNQVAHRMFDFLTNGTTTTTQIKQINQKNTYGETPLMLALKNKQYDLVERNLALNADININDMDGCTPMIKLILAANHHLFDLLLERPDLDINRPDFNGMTPLMYAYEVMCTGNSPRLQQLLMNINTNTHNTNNPSYFFYKLLEHPKVEINKINNYGHSIIFLILLKHYGRYYKQGIELAKEITGTDGGPATFPHCFQSSLCVAPKNTRDNCSDHIELINLLLARPDTNINSCDNFGQTLLMYVCEKEDKEMFNLLLNCPHLDPNVPDKNGKTCLMHVTDRLASFEPTTTCTSKRNVSDNDLSIIGQPDYSMMRGAMSQANSNDFKMENLMRSQDPFIVETQQMPMFHSDPDRNRPYKSSYMTCYYFFNRLITHAGTDLNVRDYSGDTILLHLCAKNSQLLVSTLLQLQKLDINVQNFVGDTALMLATRSGNWGLTELLIRAGLNTDLKNGEGKTAVDYASDNGVKSTLLNILDKYKQGKKGWFT